MLNKLHLEIENNNDLSNNYTVMINGKVINMEKHKDILEYNYVTKSDKCEINIYGEDIWNKDESIQRKIVWLSIFDFQFGNSMENLPISAHYSKNFDYNEKSEYNLHLTEKDFVKVEKSSLSYWNKCSLIQTILCTLLLTVVLVLLGFVFSNFVFKVIFYIIALALVSFIFVVLNRKRKELYKKLFIFSNKKYF